MLFCPNSIAEVKAEQNRQQFRFVVEDAAGYLGKANASGGRGELQESDGITIASIYDPDGNSMELVAYG